MAHRDPLPLVLPHVASAELPDGRVLEVGDEFTVKGHGRFSFRYLFTRDGSLTCWGPVLSQQAQWRSFDPGRHVITVHRKPLMRRAS